MKRNRYTPEQKLTALEQLAANLNDVSLTSSQTGIPQRTLRDWLQLSGETAVPQQKHTQPALMDTRWDDEPTDKAEQLGSLRTRLMCHILRLADDLESGPDALNIRAIAISRLIDRVLKLDVAIQTLVPETTRINIVYTYPDGTVGDVPPWEDDEQLAQSEKYWEEFRRRKNGTTYVPTVEDLYPLSEPEDK